MGIAVALKRLRTEKGLRQCDLARVAGVAQQTFSKYERACLRVPPDVAVKAAEVLGEPGLVQEYCRECPVQRGG